LALRGGKKTKPIRQGSRWKRGIGGQAKANIQFIVRGKDKERLVEKTKPISGKVKSKKAKGKTIEAV